MKAYQENKINEEESNEDLMENLELEAFIYNSTPIQNTRVTVKVTSKGQPVPGAEIKLLNHFKPTSTPYEEVTNEEGIVEIAYGIGRASSGDEVKIEVTVRKDDVEDAAETSFAPQ